MHRAHEVLSSLVGICVNRDVTEINVISTYHKIINCVVMIQYELFRL